MRRPTRSPVRSNGARAYDAPTKTLLHHLLRSKNVRVHQAQQVDAHFVLDESAGEMWYHTRTDSDNNVLRRALEQRFHLRDARVCDADE